MNNTTTYKSCSRIFSALFSTLLLTFSVVSCSPDNNETSSVGGEGMKMVIKVDGVIGTEVIQPVSKTAVASVSSSMPLTGNASAINTTTTTASGFIADAKAEQVPMNAAAGNQVLRSAVASTGNLNNNIIAATQPMPAGYTYRILIYDKATGLLWKTVQATSGTPVSLDAVKGGTYTWYAYSYNNNETIPEPANTANPAIDTAIDKDLLYATGEVVVAKTPQNQQDTYNVAITFQHKVAQVSVKVDASILAEYATINSFKASFAQNNYLKKGTFDIKGGSISNLQVIPTTDIFTTLSPTNVWEANYYTADPAALTSYKVNIDDLQVHFTDAAPAVADRNLATYNGAANKPSFTYNFTSPASGQRLLGVANLWYMLTSKRILHISNNTTYGYALEQGRSWAFLNAKENFGNLSTSLVKMAPWTPGGGAWIGGNATDDKTENWVNYSATTTGDNNIINKINPADASKKPDIIILGYDVLYIRPAVATALLDYINNNGIVIMLLQDSVGTENRSFFNGLFGVSNITLDSNGSAGAMYPLVGTDPNDKILNGQIGDARGQYWGEDAGTTLGIVNVPLSQVTVYSYGQAINRTGSNSGITMFKHNTKNFFYIGDGGFVSNGDLTSAVICPFNYDATTKRPLPKPYGDAGNGYTSRSKSAYNSVVMGNIMVWAARTSEFNGFKPWKYAAPPTP
ncbi:fimbrillin family protein [Elizabethkingia anophelis]|uniref:fimbrillin family protein n=1 Tax=Elizabethkingia anophelis TaxID=1117645 RepID=UPI0021A57832|nr:fimbrillin family protein [Elizabethkingia anophelis]MCT3674520.1 fimbrillin family protein [Elizabethkingia anophelis]MCT3681999.1 fimbrillin family protein [Elizabethkingia anophelis]MCT3703868.1 fimbrillin family protein [Elizabethkingia anophelis]MCT3770382.1 fimbrillin family protein [Elizabethkingia anophelis]MCT3780667.1 fimbrillin family protein [Elizabethkingia anophelis]